MANIDVKITAETVSLQANLARARAELSATTSELNKLARQAQNTGMTAELRPQLLQASEAALAARNNVTKLSTALQEHRNQVQPSIFSVKGLTAAWGEFSAALGTVGIAIGVAEIIHLGAAAIEAAAHIEHEAQVLGLTSTEFQVFAESARLAGVEQGVAELAIRRYNAAQGAAQDGVALQAKAFRDLGVSVDLPAREALPRIARALLNIEDVGRRSRIEVELFGRSGEELNPVLEQWARGTDKLNEDLSRMGVILDPKVTSAAHEADIKFKEMSDRFGAFVTPAITALGNAALWTADRIGDLVSAANDVIVGGGALASGWTASAGHINEVAEAAEAAARAHKKIVDRADEAASAEDHFGFRIAEVKTHIDQMKAGLAALAGDKATPAITAKMQEYRDRIRDANTELARLRKEQAGPNGSGFANAGAAEIAATHEQISAIEADETKSHAERSAMIQAFYQKLLASSKLNAAQILQIRTEMNRALAAEERTAQNERLAIARNETATALEIDKIQLNEKKALLEQEYQDGQITMQDKLALLRQFVIDQGKLDEDAVTLSEAWMRVGTVEYAAAENRKLVIHAETAAQLAEIDAKAASESASAWQKADSEIYNAEDQLVNALFSRNQSLVGALASMAEDLVKKELAADLKYLTQSLILKEQGAAGDRAIHAGLLFTYLFGESRHTAATAAGESARLGIKKAAKAEESATDLASGSAQIMNDAAKAAAGAYQAVVGIPIVGPILAPIAAGTAFAAVAAFDTLTSFDVGTNYVPRDMVAKVHKGERIIPPAENAALMSAIGARESAGRFGGGTGDVHLHYGPQYHAPEVPDLRKLLDRDSRYMVGWIMDQMRNGQLKISSSP